MANIASDETKKIPAEHWAKWSTTFINGSRGRPVKIDLVSDEVGAEPLADGATLVVLDYDPAGKGNDFVISYGDEAAPSSHVVVQPAALWQAQDGNGLWSYRWKLKLKTAAARSSRSTEGSIRRISSIGGGDYAEGSPQLEETEPNTNQTQ